MNMGYKGNYIETNVPCNAHKDRVWYVNREGVLADLMPTHTPPIIHGVAQDGAKLLIDLGQGTQDMQPDILGLTAQSVAALSRLTFPPIV